MKPKIFSTGRVAGVLFLCLFIATSARAAQGDLKLEAQLIWGTNDSPAKGRTNQVVQPGLEKKLKRLPLKWEHYYVVSTQSFLAPENETARVAMSAHCNIAVKNLGNSRVELSLTGKGKPVGKITQSLDKGQTLVTGGNADNLTGWFIVLRQGE